jgi:NADPH2:quinone reductase
LPKPVAGPGEVLVAIRASAVNPSDTKGRGGARGNVAMPFPLIIPHQDGSGIIEAVGDDVDSGRLGERVWVYEAQLGRASGTAAEYTAVPAHQAVPLPDGVSFEEGACLGVPALTAHRCIFADGSVRGQTILVTGGAGAVGHYAIQFAKHGGALTIATVSTGEQAAAAREAGADLVINRSEEDIVARLSEFVGSAAERNVDRIVEVAFGANLETSMRILKPRGVIATYSSDAVPEPALRFWPLLMLDATIRLVLVYAMSREAHEEGIAATVSGLQEKWLKHRIAALLPLEQIAEAHEMVEAGGGGGKVILTMGR